jgi:hypothetical protein
MQIVAGIDGVAPAITYGCAKNTNPKSLSPLKAQKPRNNFL